MKEFIKETIIYECSDGTLFKSKSEAEDHESTIKLTQIVNTWTETFYYKNMPNTEVSENITKLIKKL
jgi:hypothetical protein